MLIEHVMNTVPRIIIRIWPIKFDRINNTVQFECRNKRDWTKYELFYLSMTWTQICIGLDFYPILWKGSIKYQFESSPSKMGASLHGNFFLILELRRVKMKKFLFSGFLDNASYNWPQEKYEEIKSNPSEPVQNCSWISLIAIAKTNPDRKLALSKSRNGKVFSCYGTDHSRKLK